MGDAIYYKFIMKIGDTGSGPVFTKTADFRQMLQATPTDSFYHSRGFKDRETWSL